MKNLILAIVILVIGAGIILEDRYKLVIDSPVVAKLDRLTGDVWIANAGVWRKIQPVMQKKNDVGSTETSQPAATAE